MTAEQNKALVRRLVEEAVNPRNLDALEEVATGEFAVAARRWVEPFRAAFTDFTMEIVDLVADSDKVAAHFRCSGTHLGEWMGHPPTGRRFADVDEMYIFRVRDGKLAGAFGVEDNLARMRQLGLTTCDLLPTPNTALPFGLRASQQSSLPVSARRTRRVRARLSRGQDPIGYVGLRLHSGGQSAGLHFYPSPPRSRTYYSAAYRADHPAMLVAAIEGCRVPK